MDKKLEELLNTINFPEEEYSSFFNVSLKKVKVSKNKMHIVLSSDIPLKLNVYLKLNELLNNFFNTECVLEIDASTNDLTNIRECYNYAASSLVIPLLKDRLKNNYNSYYIEFNNENEFEQCREDVKKVNEIGKSISKNFNYDLGNPVLKIIKRQIYPFWLMYLGYTDKEKILNKMIDDKIGFDLEKYPLDRSLKKMNLEVFLEYCIKNNKNILKLNNIIKIEKEEEIEVL